MLLSGWAMGFGPASFIGQRACWPWPAMAGQFVFGLVKLMAQTHSLPWLAMGFGPASFIGQKGLLVMASHGWPIGFWAGQTYGPNPRPAMAGHGIWASKFHRTKWPAWHGQPWLAMVVGLVRAMFFGLVRAIFLKKTQFILRMCTLPYCRTTDDHNSFG